MQFAQPDVQRIYSQKLLLQYYLLLSAVVQLACFPAGTPG